MTETFPMPDPTLYFLGGPLDGFKAEAEENNGLDTVYPDWILPRESEHMYWRMDSDTIPEWVVKPPFMDAFDIIYLWGPYWPGHDRDDEEDDLIDVSD